MTMTDLVFWLPAVNPYWAERFSALNERRDVRFECWFNSLYGEGRSWVVPEQQLAFPHRFLGGEAKLGLWREAIQLYWSTRPRAVMTFHYDPVMWPVLLGRPFGRRVAYYAEMTWDSQFRRRPSKEMIKHLLFRAASDVFTPGQDADAYVRRYGASPRRLDHVVAPGLSGLRVGGVDQHLRLLYLGRLVPEKGLKTIQDAVDVLATRGVSVRLDVIGDGPMLDEIENWAASSPADVVLHGFLQHSALDSVLSSSDILLFPTWFDSYGLVVDEAMSVGIPVVSSRFAGEIEWRLGDGRGVILDTLRGEDWADAIAGLREDPRRLAALGDRARQFQQHRTPQHWANQIGAWINEWRR